jgi:tetratricopeptide (TPR) repeat protein
MAALTPDALWIQETWQLRQVPLQTVGGVAERDEGRELVLTLGPEPSAERLTLAFASAAEGAHWSRELQARRQQLRPEEPPGDRHLPEGVSLLRRAPDVPHVVLGRVTFADQTPRTADRGLQLRAGIRGGDAVIGVERRRCTEAGLGVRHVSGLAVRVEDGVDRQRLRLRWYAEEVGALVNRMLLFLGIQAALLFLVGVFCVGTSRFNVATGETLSEALVSMGQALGLIYAWPLVMLVLLKVLRWPQLLRATGLAVLAAMTGRGLAVWLAHLLAVGAAGAGTAGSLFWLLVDPVDWAFIITGAMLCVRAWRLAGDALHILPPEVRTVAPARKVGARGLLAVTGVYALALVGLVGVARFEASTYLLQPGVDPRREQQALLALNEGAALANQGKLDAAERSLQRSLRLWEELTAGRSAPSSYRANLALTIYNLGWLQHKRGRVDEAEKLYARAVALADELAGDPEVDDEFKQTMAGARETLAEVRRDKVLGALDEKDRTAARKYEEAQVKAGKEPAEAERLYREALTLWEEILPHADNPKYRKAAVIRLATVYGQLGELQQQLGQRPRAEATLRKAIDYGEKAVALAPDRPLPRHNLEVARRMLQELRDQALQEEITRLCNAERFADAIDLCLRSIREQEEQVRSGKDRAAARQRLAYRLARFAWFLAHCPDRRVRDPNAAVKHARRATELQPDVGDYWYTLAMVLYRNHAWRDSLAALEKWQPREGEFDGSRWLLVAMNRHQLKQKAEARTALRKAVEGIEEQQRKAEDNALLRLQYEMMRPGIEALRREAESLIEGKGSGGQGVG